MMENPDFVDMNDSSEMAPGKTHTSMLELYLDAWEKEKDDLMRNPIADKIKKLISQHGQRLDLVQAMISCRTHGFDEGFLDLLALAGSYECVLQYHIDQENSLEIIKTCDEFGDKDPNLYRKALIHYSRTGDDKLKQLLNTIEHKKLMAPMEVIRIVLQGKHTQFGLIKEYVKRYLGKLRDQDLEAQNAADQYQQEIASYTKRLEERKKDPVIISRPNCSLCQDATPTVHFFCKHSFDLNCFGDNNECPICKPSELVEKLDPEKEISQSEIDELASSLGDDVFIKLAKLASRLREL